MKRGKRQAGPKAVIFRLFTCEVCYVHWVFGWSVGFSVRRSEGWSDGYLGRWLDGFLVGRWVGRLDFQYVGLKVVWMAV